MKLLTNVSKFFKETTFLPELKRFLPKFKLSNDRELNESGKLVRPDNPSFLPPIEKNLLEKGTKGNNASKKAQIKRSDLVQQNESVTSEFNQLAELIQLAIGCLYCARKVEVLF